ncbi:hypothetical protein CCM_08450 [Cordyceps militaris CM01]|uniref:Uncharacterized protein n=1 Tax=Cordyceps militaris (strain CM01) TaxID=983644 RepID=G3JRB0_CORMM|nr:uncharacterized protein CCM_08450 [Cordyceps militaris CM01]EGX88406.1 hypothetical protein CCM_08450 [Cordyceps militaris CM01]
MALGAANSRPRRSVQAFRFRVANFHSSQQPGSWSEMAPVNSRQQHNTTHRPAADSPASAVGSAAQKDSKVRRTCRDNPATLELQTAACPIRIRPSVSRASRSGIRILPCYGVLTLE